MAKYFIPDVFKKGFQYLIELDKDSIKQVGARMSEFPVGKNPHDFYEFMKSLRIAHIDEISKTIFSFANLLLDKKGSHRAIAEGLLNAYKVDAGEDDQLAERNDEIIESLTYIFEQSKSIKLSYKGLSLLLDVPAIYRTSSIITDIRLIFNEDIEEQNRTAVITQQLKVVYSDSSSEKTFYLSLDKMDLEELKEQIERALQKEAIMRKDYSETFSFLIQV